MLKKTIFFITLVFCGTVIVAQTTCPPFWKDIQQFKKSDSAQMPPANAILFIGSSTFTRWNDLHNYFPEHTIINRGFGGSQLTDVIRYAYDVILPYHPKQVVIYCGENDLASADNIKAEDVVLRFKTLFGIIRQNLPQATIHFVSIKPSPSRLHLFPAFGKANKQIKAFLQKQKRAGFINVYDAMLTANGTPRKDIFVEDNLHMNAEGYRIWQRILLPYLKK